MTSSTSSRVLIQQVRCHYANRGFSPAVIGLLCREIENRVSDAGLRIAADQWRSIDRISELFEPIAQIAEPAILHPAPAAIFGMSFGYRFDHPFARLPEDRQPGKNNLALAERFEHCRRIFPDAWLAAQFEIGLALAQTSKVASDLISPARDWTTSEVIGYFVDHLPQPVFDGNRCIVVVCHEHHYGRCALLLGRAGFETRVPPKEIALYADYDEREAQPRFRSAWEYLLNDFIAICRMSPASPSSLASPQPGARLIR